MKKRYAISAKQTGISLMLLMFALLVAGVANAQISVEKQIALVSPASSGVSGHIDVKYEITLTNTSGAAVNSGSLGDELDNPTNLGNAFVSVVGTLPVTLENSTGLATAILNNNFDGNTAGDAFIATSIDMPNNSSITFSFVAELNPTASGNPGDLNNIAVYLTGAAVAIPSNAATLPDCWTNCVMACNNLVNIGANSNCEVEVLSQAVLEGEDQTCAAMGFYLVEITDSNGNPVASPIGKAYIGQILTATVTNIACGNSCWSKVLIEDKTAPEMSCKDTVIRCNQDISPTNLGFPVPLADILNPSGPQPYIATGIDACGNVQLTYADSIVDRGCSDTTSVIYRKWKATDASGFMAMCWDTIYLLAGTLADIDLPPHYDGISVNPDGDAPEPILPACNGSWTKFANGFPDTSATGTGAPKGVLCGKIQFFFEDDTINTCGNGYKLLRTWIIVDWCHPQDRLEYIQRIKIADLDPPVLSCPGTRFVAADTISTAPWSCTAEYQLPVPQNIEHLPAPDPHGVYVIGECSKWTYEVSHLAARNPDDCTPDAGAIPTKDNIVRVGTSPSGLPIYKVVNLPLGCNWIYYTVTDDCGHVTKCAYDIYVRDDVKPTVACDKHTVVALDEAPGGLVRVPASVFDDGSFDNCALDTMLVRRIRDYCGIRENTKFRGYVDFCCNDLNRDLSVILKVIDKAGNMSQCTVKVTVQDKLPPIITSCPKDTTIDCGVSLSGNLNARFGTPTWIDNCGATVKDSLLGSVNSCGLGTYTRVFTVTDQGGLKTTCLQRIHVVNSHPVTRKDIHFPSDTSLVNVCPGDLSPDNLGKPLYPPFDKCTQLAANYEDKVFSFVDGACIKILRVWSVLNWCTKEEWDTVQVIMVKNTNKPMILGCTTKYIDITDSSCTKDITLSVTGKDDCTPVNELKWTYTFTRSDGVKYNGHKNSATFRKVPIGTHLMTWTVEDRCGNIEKCTQRVIVRDRKKPTPYCRTGIVTVLMNTTKQIAIWANDFNIGSFDNCTAKSKLRFSFSSDTTDKGKVYGCADLGPDGADSMHTVQMWVTDEAGNQDYCEVKVLLQDNQGVCAGTQNLKASIAGNVTAFHDGATIEDAEIFLTNSAIDLVEKQMSDDHGTYLFKVPMHQNYSLKAKKNGNYGKGVSTRDIVEIQRFLLGMRNFDSPYQYIAADVNNSHSVSTADIIAIRRLVLGKDKAFKKSPSWRFLDKGYQYPDPFKPWPVKESIAIDNMSKDMMHNDFLAVKIGDLTGDAGFGLTRDNAPRSMKTLKLYTDVQKLEAGKTVKVPVYAETGIALEGMQMTIHLPGGVSFKGIESAGINLSEQNIGLQALHQGFITLSWSEIGGKEIQNNQALFFLTLEAEREVDMSEMNIGSEITKLEAFDANGLDYQIRWRVSGKEGEEVAFKLLQNTPNPFNHTTTIGFILPEASNAILTVFDMSGKVIRKIEQHFGAGYNDIVIDMNNTGVTGVMYYKLETATHSATRKMVILK